MFLVEACFFLFLLYSFVNQFLGLFSRTFEFGLRHISEYPGLVEEQASVPLPATNASGERSAPWTPGEPSAPWTRL